MERWQNSEHWPLIAAQQWDVLEAVLSDPDFLEAKVAAGLVFALVEDFAAALAHLPEGRPARRLVQLLGTAVRRDAAFLARHPGALFQCLWNTAWWGPEPQLTALLESWRASKLARSPGFTWVRSLRAPIVPLDSPLIAVLPHPFPERGKVALAFTDDGERLAAFYPPPPEGEEHSPCLWDVQTGQELPLVAGLLPAVPDPLLSPDGRYRLDLKGWHDATLSGPIVLCQSASKKRVFAFPTIAHVGFQVAAFSPDGRRVVAGGCHSDGGALVVWDLDGPRELFSDYQLESVWAIAFSPDGECLAVGTGDETELRETVTGRRVATLSGHQAFVDALAFASNGRLLASADDRTVRLWDLNQATPLPLLPPHPDSVEDLVFSTNGARLVSRSTNDTTWLWNGNTGVAVASLYSSTGVMLLGGSAKGCVFADHQRVISVAGCSRFMGGGGAGIWDAATGTLLASIPEEGCFFSSVLLALSRDGQLLAEAHLDTSQIRLRDPTTGTVRRELDGHAQEVRCLAFAPNGQLLVSGARDGTVRVWSMDSPTPQASLDGHKGFVTDVAFSADATLVVSAATDRTVRVWNVADGAELACLTPADPGEFSRETRWSEGQKTQEEIHYAIQKVAFTSDSQSVVTLSEDNRLRWWDWRRGVCWQSVRGAGDFRAIAASLPYRALVRDGVVVIEASDTGEVVGWLPCAPSILTTHPGGRIWAGARGRHLFHFALEWHR